jgi:hypothetical protein
MVEMVKNYALTSVHCFAQIRHSLLYSLVLLATADARSDKQQGDYEMELHHLTRTR